VSSTSRELLDQWNAPAGFSVNVATANASQVKYSFSEQKDMPFVV
jgi:hypothetical protein